MRSKGPVNNHYKTWSQAHETLGGPFIFLTKKAFAEWRGNDDRQDEVTDYMRCDEVTDWTGTIELNKHPIFVLWGAPIPLRIWVASKTEVFICRTWATETPLFDIPPEVPNAAPLEVISFCVASNDCILTDAVYTKHYNKWVEEVSVEEGRYVARTWDISSLIKDTCILTAITKERSNTETAAV